MTYSDQVSEIEARPEESVREIPESTPNTLPNAAISHCQIPSFIRTLGAGIISDIRARIPWYLSDWTDAWNYRVVPATAHIFFAKYVDEYYALSLLSQMLQCFTWNSIFTGSNRNNSAIWSC